MSNPIFEKLDTSEYNDEANSLTGLELGDVNSAGSNLCTP